MVSFVRGRYAKNLQYFIGIAFLFHIMVDNSNKTVYYDGNSNLDTYCILCGTPKFLNLKMQVQPFEEKFDQPSFLVRKRICLNSCAVIYLAAKLQIQIRFIAKYGVIDYNSIISKSD